MCVRVCGGVSQWAFVTHPEPEFGVEHIHSALLYKDDEIKSKNGEMEQIFSK